MQRKNLFLYLLILGSFYACKTEYAFVINAPQKIQINKELRVSLTEKNNQPFDSVQFFINNKPLNNQTAEKTISIENYKLGKQTLSALVFYKNKTKKITKPIYFMATTPPKIYTYKIINTYPHDPNAYTQGLEYYNGFLYEGTGRKGKSSIRKVELTTGKVLQKHDLSDKYFGEGITIFNNKLYQLTWQEGVGFVYDLETFKQEKTFSYKKSLEGWGLTHNKTHLIKSDGTERLWFLNPETLEEESYIEVYTNTQKVEKVNELEYINGKIYANRWELNSILIINPNTGHVEGVADLNGLKQIVQQTQNLDERDEVLNGIAYDKEKNRLFVTGKHWNKLFEIEFVEKK